MVIKNKKAIAYEMWLFLIIYLVLSGTLMIEIFNERRSTKGAERYLGDYSIAILQTYNSAQKQVLYHDIAVERSAYNSIFEMAENGGFYHDSECGTYNGYQVWSKKCAPELNSSFSSYFHSHIDNFYTAVSGTYNFPLNNFNISLVQDNNTAVIVGKARNVLSTQGIAEDFTSDAGVWDPSVSIEDYQPVNRDALNLEAYFNSNQIQTFNNLLTTAESFLGVEYVWGGQTPFGFDCSGFIYFIFTETGLPYGSRKTTASMVQELQMQPYFVECDVSDTKPGDLLVYRPVPGTDKEGHVVMVVDPVNNIVINSDGKGGVRYRRLSSLENPYNNPEFKKCWRNEFFT